MHSNHPSATSAPDDIILLASMVRRGRVKKGWRQQDLADRLNVGVSTIRRLESGAKGTSVACALTALREVGMQLSIQERDVLPATATPADRMRHKLTSSEAGIRAMADDL